jgi:hypothetical protein
MRVVEPFYKEQANKFHRASKTFHSYNGLFQPVHDGQKKAIHKHGPRKSQTRGCMKYYMPTPAVALSVIKVKK